MKKSELKRYEALLLKERKKLLNDMGLLEKDALKHSLKESSGELSAYRIHWGDMATDSMEREKIIHFASKEGRLLYHIDEALRRIYRNQYGNCEECGNPISKQRLNIIPYARLCIKCKEKEEKKAVKGEVPDILIPPEPEY